MTTRNQRYEAAQKEADLCKVTVWCPNHAKEHLKELMAIICEYHKESGEFHKELVPFMYRDLKTGVMGTKSVDDVKKGANYP